MIAIAYFVISLEYKNNMLDYPHWQYFIATTQNTWEWDHYSFGRLQDCIVYTFQGAMAVFVASQVGTCLLVAICVLMYIYECV